MHASSVVRRGRSALAVIAVLAAVVALVPVAALAPAAHAEPAQTWSAVTPPEANAWQSVAYGAGVWVAVASDGANRVMRSTDDGATWTAITAPEQNEWRSVGYGTDANGAGVWVAVASDGANRVMRSTDAGLTWTTVSVPTTVDWQSVAFGGGVWVAVGIAMTSVKRIMRSTDDGATWTLAGPATTSNLLSVAYTQSSDGRGLWAAVAMTGSGYPLRTSQDGGVTWPGWSSGSPALAVTANGSGGFVSVDAERLVSFTVPVSGAPTNTISSTVASDWTAIAAGPTSAVAVSAGNGPSLVVLDRVSSRRDWYASALNPANGWSAVAYGNGRWVTVARSGGADRVAVAVDVAWPSTPLAPVAGTASGWQAISPAVASSWRSVAYGGGVWVAVSSNGTNRVMRSTNGGLTWGAVAAAEANSWYSVAYGDGVWVAVSHGGTNRVMRSTDGALTWTAVPAPETNVWNSVAFGDGVWVAVAGSGTNRVMRSTDAGLTWTAVAAETSEWNSVAYGDGVFVAVANAGTNRIMRSADAGLTWTPVAAPEANAWWAVAHGNGAWVAVASSGSPNRVMRSTDGGLTWAAVAVPRTAGLQSVAYGDGTWVAVSYGGSDPVRNERIVRSTDGGVTWELMPPPAQMALYRGIAFGNGVWVAVSSSSADGVSWTARSPIYVAPSHAVTFRANDGSNAALTQTANAPAVLLPNAFVRAGYAFAGWTTNADGTGTAYAGGATYAFAVDLTLYAQWTTLPAHTVTFDANDGSSATQTQSMNAPTALVANPFTRPGYTFAGWTTNADGTGTAYGNGATYAFTADMTLYAKWILGTAYTVTFLANDGLNAVQAQVANAATSLLPNPFTRPGYAFAGWTTNADGTGTAYVDTATYAFTSNLTLFAQWTELPLFVVTFEMNDGSNAAQVQAGNVPAALVPNAFARAGYAFAGWTTNADGTGTAYGNGVTYDFTADMTLYAQWTAVPSGPLPSTPSGSSSSGSSSAGSSGASVGEIESASQPGSADAVAGSDIGTPAAPRPDSLATSHLSVPASPSAPGRVRFAKGSVMLSPAMRAVVSAVASKARMASARGERASVDVRLAVGASTASRTLAKQRVRAIVSALRAAGWRGTVRVSRSSTGVSAALAVVALRSGAATAATTR